MLAVGGLCLPKVLKNMINNVFQVKYMHRNLRTWNEVVHNMENMIGTKVDAVLKLRAKELRLNGRKRNRLKGEKAI
jgi:UDP-glucose 6-dehydrogenase